MVALTLVSQGSFGNAAGAGAVVERNNKTARGTDRQLKSDRDFCYFADAAHLFVSSGREQ